MLVRIFMNEEGRLIVRLSFMDFYIIFFIFKYNVFIILFLLIGGVPA